MEGDCCERRRSYSAWSVAFSSSSSLYITNQLVISPLKKPFKITTANVPNHCFDFFLVIRVKCG
jgi:hypothetical protein